MKVEKLKEIFIAALIGAFVSFLTHVTESLTSVTVENVSSATGGIAGSVAYVFRNLSRFI